MSGHICFSVKKKCWNLFDSYGEICVHCGCCSTDKRTRYESRLARLKEWLQQAYDFDYWADDEQVRATQEKNRLANIEWNKRRIRYYERKLKKLDVSDTNVGKCD